MAQKDPRIDAYIEKSADFAKPILHHIRKLVHKVCPDVQETWKWSFPHFDYNGPLCHMAAFKAHCAFGFWKAALMKDNKSLFEPIGETAMGHFGKLTSLKDLPADKVIIEYIKEAMELNDKGVKLPPKAKKDKPAVVPEELSSALNRNKKAKTVFENFSNSNQREYIEWINEAKTEATKEKRVATAIEWISEGKVRNWKYIKK